MANFMSEELGHRLNWLRDEQARTNVSVETRLKELEADNADLRQRLTVLTRLLIAKQIAPAEEIAMLLANAATPSEAAPMDSAPTEGPVNTES
ncbi:MAG TPA: hypothetical protein VGM98_21350 [Schlesneria sp.]|jgi:hypothetical protein